MIWVVVTESGVGWGAYSDFTEAMERRDYLRMCGLAAHVAEINP